MNLRYLVLTLGIVLSSPALAQAARSGPAGSGGGDRCENRAKVIMHDIKSWVEAGGGRDLDFSKLRRASDEVDYQTRMLQVLARPTRIKCVVPGDQDYPVLVNEKPKECRSFVDNEGTNQIICDLNRFYSRSKSPEGDSAQYLMLHHELATLAELELPIGDDSEYLLSNQISDYLENQVVKRLAVKNRNQPGSDGVFRMPLNATPQQCVELVAKHYLKSSGADQIFEASNFAYNEPWSIWGAYYADNPHGTFTVRDREKNVYRGQALIYFKEAVHVTAGMYTYYKSCKLVHPRCEYDPPALSIKSKAGKIIFGTGPFCRPGKVRDTDQSKNTDVRADTHVG